MKIENKNLLRIRIAANILYRINREFKIEYTGSPIYDFIVYYVKDNFRFAVKVGSSTYKESSSFAEYINILNSNTIMEDTEQIPIVLMCVNESIEEARMGIIFGWENFSPVIYKQVSLRVVNTQNWLVFEENIKKMDSVIRILSEETICVIKHITITEVDKFGNNHKANIIYLRTFSNEYKMHKKKLIDEKEDFKRKTYGIPEDEYPSDRFDKDLLEMLQQRYPTSKVKSNLMLFKTNLNNLQAEIESFHSYNNVTLILKPNFQDNVGMVDYFKIIQFKLNLYVSSSNDKMYFEDVFLSKSVPLNQWGETFEYYSLIRNSVRTPESFFI